MWQSIAADASVRLMTDRIDAAAPAAQAQAWIAGVGKRMALGRKTPAKMLREIFSFVIFGKHHVKNTIAVLLSQEI